MNYQHRPAQGGQLPSSSGSSEIHCIPDCTAEKPAANKYVCKGTSKKWSVFNATELDITSKGNWQGVLTLQQQESLELQQASANQSTPLLSPRHYHKKKTIRSSLLGFNSWPGVHTRTLSDAYKGADARALLRLPPTNVVKTTWPGGARSGNMDDENSVPAQTKSMLKRKRKKGRWLKFKI